MRVAMKMEKWILQVRDVASNIRCKVNGMQNWQDEQSVRFREVAENTALNLSIHMDNLAKISTFLRQYGKRLEDEERQQGVRMRNINQR